MSSPETAGVVVIGAGAAGLMTAIEAANIRVEGKAAKVLLLDGREKIGAKILVSGGTRCNVTNEFVHPSRFNTESDPNREFAKKGDGGKSFVGRVLRAFSPEATTRFFESRGCPLKLEETGKYFPVSDSARDVLNLLVRGVADASAELRTGLRVNELERGDDGWRIATNAGDFEAGAVVICTGGLALPKSGSDGAGYGFARQFGHSIIATTPALTPLLARSAPHENLSGIAVPARLALQDGQSIARHEGSFLFTHQGYSGPVALNISRHFARRSNTGSRVTMRILPQVAEGAEGAFWQEFVKAHSKKTLPNALSEYLPRRVRETIVAQALGEKDATTFALGRLSSEQQKTVRAALFDLPLALTDVADYVKAEATAGGVSLAEIEPATMMSKLQHGLFFSGEVCDVDGWLGGYNFQWAWSSGAVAGRAAARWVLRDSKI